VEVTFDFDAELWEWDARDDTSWVFVTLPLEVADEIRDLGLTRRGFGSVRVRVRCGRSAWSTSVFPDSKSGSYVLPLKKPIRRAEGIEVGDTARFEIDITLD
jgi:hypothetical protein